MSEERTRAENVTRFSMEIVPGTDTADQLATARRHLVESTLASAGNMNVASLLDFLLSQLVDVKYR